MAKIAILGTGAWGTTLANILIENKHHVLMWGIDKNEISNLKNGKNEQYFGNKKLINSPKLVTNNFSQIALQKPQYVLIAVPSSFIMETLSVSLKKMANKPIIINVAKGLDPMTDNVWSKSIYEKLSKKISGLVSLSGPSFAKETFYDYPTIINAISSTYSHAKLVANLFNNNHFKCVPIKDEIGGQILGAFKNIIAIAMGMIYYLYDSSNTRAAMLSQGTREIINISNTLGGQISTLYEFCGIGDIYLTCTDTKSRNFLFGEMIAKNGIKYALQHFNKTIEGYNATDIAYDIIKKKKLSCPLIEETYRILYQGVNHKSIVKNIMSKL